VGSAGIRLEEVEDTVNKTYSRSRPTDGDSET
jgi:hypothetical protein